MRIATLIIALLLMVVLSLQSCAVYVLSPVVGEEETAEGGAVGLFVAFLFLLGAAFVIAKPGFSMVLFTLGGLLGLGIGSSTDFADMSFWGVVSLILAAMSYFGRRELARKGRSQAAIDS